MKVHIDRCVCTNQSFAHLLDVAQQHQCDYHQLRARTDAGNHCGLCRPYVKCMLRTGQTVFHQILVDTPEADHGAA